ncbi:hypothetical protein ANANG_G00232290, partial [Anguilla anguilla]
RESDKRDSPTSTTSRFRGAGWNSCSYPLNALGFFPVASASRVKIFSGGGMALGGCITDRAGERKLRKV